MADKWRHLRMKYQRIHWDKNADGFVNLLPDHITMIIFKKLEIEDLMRAAMVSTKWQHMCTDDELWKPLYKRRWRVTKAHPEAWVDLFAKQYRSSNDEWASGHPTMHVVKLERPARAVQFNGDIAVIAQDKDIVQVSLSQSEAIPACVWQGHEGAVTCLHFDEKLLCSGGEDGCLKIWPLTSDGPKAPEPRVNIRPDPGMMGTAGITSLRFDEVRGMCGRSGGVVDVWDVEENRASMRIFAHSLAVTDIQFDDYRLVTSSLDGLIKLWDLRSLCKEPVQTINTGGPLYAFQYNLDRVMAGCSDGSVGAWDMRLAKPLTRYSLSATTTTVTDTTTTTASKSQAPITTLSFDAQYLVAGTVGGVVHVVQHNRLSTPTFATTLAAGDGSKGGVSGCQFDASIGRIVASTLDQPMLYVYNFQQQGATPLITV